MSYRFLLLAFLIVLALALLSQSQVTAATNAAPALVQETAPKPSPEALARAKKLYGYDCAMCHGEAGDGKGDLAGDFKTKPRDYTDPASLKDFSDAQLF